VILWGFPAKDAENAEIAEDHTIGTHPMSPDKVRAETRFLEETGFFGAYSLPTRIFR